LFDISFLRCIPNAVIMQPGDEDALCDMLATALHVGGPMFIRYPRGHAEGVPIKEEPRILEIGKAEVIVSGKDCVIWALGPMVKEAMLLAPLIEENSGLSVGVVDARFAKPIDRNLLIEQCADASLIVTMEDQVKAGGFGSAIQECIQDAALSTPVCRIGWPDSFVGHASSVAELRSAHGLTTGQMLSTVLDHAAIRQHRHRHKAATVQFPHKAPSHL
ncbi:MAG: 1-deoxy-D-xylulose-5-phosphate synthase, partial [Opitutales bacterium]|nr:1-deoxy-D-xylulose-5-phosphate synthase [Opitutales bacterium]